MSNLSRLQAVSSSLDTAIQKVNNLPDASGSGGGGLETVTLKYLSPPEPEMVICYIDSTLTYIRTPVIRYEEYNVLKGSIIVLISFSGDSFDKCTYIAGNSMCRAFLVTG